MFDNVKCIFWYPAWSEAECGLSPGFRSASSGLPRRCTTCRTLPSRRACRSIAARALDSQRKEQGNRMNRIVVASLLAASALVSVARAQEPPTIRVGWTIPAEESKYWMMRRPDKFPNLGKGYKIEWSQFQGTTPMTQAPIAGARPRRPHARLRRAAAQRN